MRVPVLTNAADPICCPVAHRWYVRRGCGISRREGLGCGREVMGGARKRGDGGNMVRDKKGDGGNMLEDKEGS